MGTGSTIQLANDKPKNYQLEIQHKELPVTNGLVLARLCYFDRSYICKLLQHFPKLEIMYIHISIHPNLEDLLETFISDSIPV